MTAEKLEKAKLLESQIKLLKDEKEKYQCKYGCYLQLRDHHGNNWQLLRLYAIPFELTKAMGYDLEHSLLKEFQNYLASIQQQFDKRIDELQIKLDNL